jgi:hypothetical protein
VFTLGKNIPATRPSTQGGDGGAGKKQGGKP